MQRGYRLIVLTLVVSLLTIGGVQFSQYRSNPETIASTPLIVNGNVAAVGLSFDGAVAWVKTAGYLAMFIAMLFEGPVITAAAAFGAALGYFNVWIVLVLSILGDIVADLVYYSIGYFSRVSVIEKFGHRFGLSRERMKKIERLLHTHPIKTLLFIKLAPVLPTPGLMIVGTVRMPIGKYTMLCTLITLPKVLLFMALGYYFGAAYDTISNYAQSGEYFIIVAIAITVGVYWAYQKMSVTISQRLQVA